jgi:hypothetical protein
MDCILTIMIELKDITTAEMLLRFKKYDLWRLEDIILFVFGYEHSNVDWDYLHKTNSFPVRQYYSAIQATSLMPPLNYLACVSKKPAEKGFYICYVKKGTFITWAFGQWGEEEPRVKKTYNLWIKYKDNNKSTAPSLQKSEAIIKAIGDKIQIFEYNKHQINNKAKEYNANISQIASQIYEDNAINRGLKYRTIKKYIKRMDLTDLEKEYQATKANCEN